MIVLIWATYDGQVIVVLIWPSDASVDMEQGMRPDDASVDFGLADWRKTMLVLILVLRVVPRDGRWAMMLAMPASQRPPALCFCIG